MITMVNSLLRDIIEGSIKGKRQKGRPRQATFDWMMKNNGHSYSTLRDGSLKNIVETVVHKTCLRAENLKKKRRRRSTAFSVATSQTKLCECD